MALRPGSNNTLSLLAAVMLLTAIVGCSYTQLATTPAEYDSEPMYDTDYLPEVARGAWGQLSVWGYWVEVPEFGWVWQPDVAYDWQPYLHGHWTWTSYGWTWLSYEPFGWITYHYGFWHFNPHYGWFWIPDDLWYACGATWLYYDDYVCWAPIPPPGYHLLDPWYTHTDYVWMVVDINHFLNPNIGSYKYRHLRPDPRRGSKKVYRSAPEKIYVERRLGRKIREVDVEVGKVRKGNHEYKRVKFPMDETRTVDRYQPKTDEKYRPTRPTSPPKKSSGSSDTPATRKKGAKPKSEAEKRGSQPSKSKSNKGGEKKSKKKGS